MNNENSNDDDLFREAMNGTVPLRYATKHTTHRKKYQRDSEKQPVKPTNDDKRYVITVPYCNEQYLKSVNGDQQLFCAKAGVQTRIIRKLRRGQFPIEAELDLHGLTVDEAHAAIEGFLNDCQIRHKRHLCIIHGKGLHSNEGKITLKSMVNSWLRQLDVVLAFCSAQPKDGGSGAVYLLIKRMATKV